MYNSAMSTTIRREPGAVPGRHAGAMRGGLFRTAAAASLLLAACAVPAPGPRGPNPAVIADEEPVSFLLERADSLQLPDTTRLALARLNLRLFQRNQPLRFALDTLLEKSAYRPRPGRPPEEQEMPAELRERVDPLVAQIRAHNAAARDTAWAMLTTAQREKAEQLRARFRPDAERAPQGGPQRP